MSRRTTTGIEILPILGLLTSYSLLAQLNTSAGVKTGAPPAWVECESPSPPTKQDQRSLPGGQAYAFFDQQINFGTTQSFVRVVKDIVNETGVQNGANLSFTFDPSFQELRLHHITVERDGRKRERLDLASVKLIQQETDLDRQIYNGALSALVFLEDIRVGDRIDYAYTLTGNNPVLQGHQAGSFMVRLTVPVQRLRSRLLVPEDRHLFYRAHGQPAEPVIQRTGDQTEYVWDLSDPPAVQLEDQVPSWVTVLPWIQFADFPDWRSVAQWAASLYESSSLDAPDFSHQVEVLRRGGDAESEIDAALRFVQNEIRYLGIEFGPNSYRPTEPATVLKQRFGDCKDKAFLLCALLRKLGHEATPVLVATGFRHLLADLLPSPYDFDHVIVQVKIGPRTCWIDPTRSYQRGPLRERYLPDYAFGLRLHPEETALTPIPASTSGRPEAITEETFHVGRQKRPARLDVISTFNGFDAEWIRSSLASNGRERLGKSWLNDYAQRYPAIAPAGDLVINDFTNRDCVVVQHSYVISNFWVLREDRQAYTCSFYPHGIRAWITKPTTTLRTLPIALDFPRHRIVKTTVELPEDWALTNFAKTISASAARLALKRSYADRTLTLDYDYLALTNHVPVDDAADYLHGLDEMENVVGYSLSWQNEDTIRGSRHFNWPVFALASAYVTLLGAGAVFGYRRLARSRGADLEPVPPLLDSQLSGLGGWLILVGLNLTVSPLMLLVRLGQSLSSFAPLTWQALTSPGGVSYNPLWGPVLVFELLGQLTLVALCLFVLVLFLEKRRHFPRWFILLLLVSAAFTVADNVAAHALHIPVTPKEQQEYSRDVTRVVIACSVWIPYMLRSRRVKATFVR